MADIDHFKKVNDTYGHDAGDLVLKEFAQRVSPLYQRHRSRLPFGWEEFLIIMPDADSDVAYQIAERIRDCVCG